MTAHEQVSERAAGGSLGKVMGRARVFVGSAFASGKLDRDGRLLQVRIDAETDPVGRGQIADEKDERAKLAIVRAEVETERWELEQGLSGIAAEQKRAAEKDG